jgi:HSP20 family protein
MFYRTLSPRDIFAELSRLQRELAQSNDLSPNIRGVARGGFPALNIGHTADTVELYAFAPGLDPETLDVQIEKGVLTIAGERNLDLPKQDDKTTIHIEERFSGGFRRVLTLSEDIDPNGVEARYRDGILHISIQRRTAAQPRRIAIQ